MSKTEAIMQRTFSDYSDWISPIHKGFSLACCDCGLGHDIDFRVLKDGKVLHGVDVQFRMRRNNYTSGQLRRHRNMPKLTACCYCGKEL